jgi:hypothetical protein
VISEPQENQNGGNMFPQALFHDYVKNILLHVFRRRPVLPLAGGSLMVGMINDVGSISIYFWHEY